MKYIIVHFQNGMLRVDMGQNGGFDTIQAAALHAKAVGIAQFAPLQMADTDTWASIPNNPPSVTNSIKRNLKKD